MSVTIDLQKKMIAPASRMLALQQQEEQKVRKLSLDAYGQLVEANLLITGVIASILFRLNGRVSMAFGNVHERMSLLSSFVIGIDLCERSISGGKYIQASALLRQEMEILAALNELKLNKRVAGKTPNICHLDLSMRKLYSDLTDATHVSKPHILSLATQYKGGEGVSAEDTFTSRNFVELDAELARRLYALHVLIMMHIVGVFEEHLQEVYSDELSEDEALSFQCALEHLIDTNYAVLISA